MANGNGKEIEGLKDFRRREGQKAMKARRI